MDTPEPISVLNKRLRDVYGMVWDGRPIFHIIWSEDEFEVRRCTHTDAGIELLIPEMRQVRKYAGWVKNKYVLERLVAVPSVNSKDLAEKTSYEPLWVFEDLNRNALPPIWEACEIVIDSLYAALGKGSMYRKYVNPEENETLEEKNIRLQKLQEALFGNETPAGDALAYREGIVVPSNYKLN